MKLNQSNEYITELEFDCGDVKFVCQKFHPSKTLISLDYDEACKSLDLTKQDAEAIIEFLKYSFDLE